MAAGDFQKLNDGEDKGLVFERYMENEKEGLIKYIYYFTRDYDVMNDYFQDISIKAWCAFDNFDQNKSFHRWVFRIAKNYIIDEYRKKKYRDSRPQYYQFILSEDFTDTLIDSIYLNDQFTYHLSTFPPAEQKILKSIFIDGATCTEASVKYKLSTFNIVKCVKAFRNKILQTYNIDDSNSKYS